jgi:hypothetical protein
MDFVFALKKLKAMSTFSLVLLLPEIPDFVSFQDPADIWVSIMYTPFMFVSPVEIEYTTPALFCHSGMIFPPHISGRAMYFSSIVSLLM